MSKYSFLIALSLFLNACTENDLNIPKEFEYEGSSFAGDIVTYNSSGKLLNSIAPFSQQDFLFKKNPGIYPIDKIVLSHKNLSQFFVSNNMTSFVLEGDYLISGNQIMLDMYFKNNDTLKLSADYNPNKLSIEAYGFKIYGPNPGNNGAEISSANDFGSVVISKLLRYAKPTDTICIQRIYQNYKLK